MSLSIWITAQKEITDQDKKLIAIIDGCESEGVDPPMEIVDKLMASLGPDWVKKAMSNWGCISEAIQDNVVEFTVYDHPAIEGDPMTAGGAVIYLDRLPTGTTKLRVHASA